MFYSLEQGMAFQPAGEWQWLFLNKTHDLIN